MRKRRPFGLAVVLNVIASVAAITPAWGQITTADAKGTPPKYDAVSVERGHKAFVGTCGFCHGSNAKGGEKGPDLLRSVLVLHDENGTSIAPVILKGRVDKGMPRFSLPPQQISDIANFLHNAINTAADRDNYKILNIVTGDAKAGRDYFTGAGRCGSCHSVTGDLKGIASKYEAATLQTKFIQPNYSWMEGNPPKPVFAISVTVTLPSGESFTGKPVNFNDFNVSLTEADGTYRSFRRTDDAPKVEINNRLQGHLDLLKQYKDSDIHNVTAYLVTLK